MVSASFFQDVMLKFFGQFEVCAVLEVGQVALSQAVFNIKCEGRDLKFFLAIAFSFPVMR